jgi:hypothetical protein
MMKGMPEGPEIETDRLQETIEEPPPGALLRKIALTTAVLAALGAVAALRAGGTVNEALVLKTEAARLQSEASDQWAYYQAKGIKANVEEVSREAWIAAGKTPPPNLEETARRYATEQKDIERAAQEKEHERDEKSNEADRLLEHHHRFADSVAFIQVAIALGAVSALTRQRSVWVASGLLGAIGAGLFAFTLLR